DFLFHSFYIIKWSIVKCLKHRTESLLYFILPRGCHCRKSPVVERLLKCNDLCFPGCFTRLFNRCFICFCATVAKKHIVTCTVCGKQLSNFFLKWHMIKIGNMPVFIQLFFNRLLYVRMAMSQVTNTNS